MDLVDYPDCHQGTARFWMKLQANDGLSRAMQREQPEVKQLAG